MRNKARPEGSIAESYIDGECLSFCSMYLEGIETKFNREERNYDGGQGQSCEGLHVFGQIVRPLGSGSYEILDIVEYNKIRYYVLNNSEEIASYRE